MLCPRCNNQLEDEATFCGACGALIKPKLSGETVLEAPDSLAPGSPATLAPTRYALPHIPMQQMLSTMVASGPQLPDEQSGSQRSTRDTSLPSTPFPRKNGKPTSRLFVILAILTLGVVIVGGISWFLLRTGFKTSTPATAVVAKGQVSFLDSQDSALGATNALKVTATGLPNPPDGSEYDAWLMDTINEQILPLGSLSKSDPTTFALSYPNAGSPSQA